FFFFHRLPVSTLFPYTTLFRSHAVGGGAMGLKRQILPLDLVHVLAVVLYHGDTDAITGADVVQQEVAVGMECLVAECLGNGEFPAVRDGARGRGGQRRDVADGAADPGEPRLAFPGRRRRSLPGVARRG